MMSKRREGRFLDQARGLAGFVAAATLASALSGSPSLAASAQQAATDPAQAGPDATPLIQKIEPDHGAPGEQVTVVVRGANFYSGGYVSASSPFIDIGCTQRMA